MHKDDKNLVEQGFTLVELLIVVVILGILAGIVVFAVGNLSDSAQTSACDTDEKSIETAVQAYLVQNPGDTMADVDLPADLAPYLPDFPATFDIEDGLPIAQGACV